jgi:hypothetical protein
MTIKYIKDFKGWHTIKEAVEKLNLPEDFFFLEGEV